MAGNGNMAAQKPSLTDLRAQLRTLEPILRDPKKLRVAVLAVLSLAAIGLVYLPLKRGIEERDAELARQEARIQLCSDIKGLEFALQRYRQHLPEQADVNYWSEHLMRGMRLEGLKLKSFEPKEQDKVKIGSMQGLVIKAELEGRYPELLNYLAWLEYNEIFVRVSQVRIQDHNGTLQATISVAAVMPQTKGRNAT